MSEKTDTDMAQALPIEQVIAFLLGEDEIYGFWYGETPKGKGNYWWRTHLRESWNAHESRAQPKTASGLEQADAQQVVHHELETKGPDQSSAQPASVAGWVMVPRILAEQVQDSLGRFTGDEGAALNDFHIADAFGACIPAAPQPPAKESE